MLKKSLLSSFLGLFIIIAASNVSAKKLHLEPVLKVGYIADPAKFKYHVAIESLGPNNCTIPWCEGAILDKWHIITNAFYATMLKNKNMFVVAGARDLHDKEAGLYREVEYLYVPKTYNVMDSHDEIAILKLKQPLPLGMDSRIQAVKLPTADHLVEKELSLLMTGYSFYEQHPVLRFDIQKNSFNHELCNANDKEFCTLSKLIPFKLTTCNDPDGTPLVEEKLLANGQFEYTLIGVSKIMNRKWCGHVTKYTKVSAYLEFISNVQNHVLNGVQSEKLRTNDKANKLREYPHCSAE